MFVQGQSGNPQGRRAERGKTIITDAIRRVLLANSGAKVRKLAEALVDRAIEESDVAAKEINERIEGKVSQPVEGSLGVQITIEIVKFAEQRIAEQVEKRVEAEVTRRLTHAEADANPNPRE